jgi:hypothetical protein
VNQLKEISARVDRKVLTLALKGTSDKLKEHFFSTMSARGVEMLKDDIESMGPVKIKDVEGGPAADHRIVRQLDAEGVISLKGTAGRNSMLSKVLKGESARHIPAMAFGTPGPRELRAPPRPEPAKPRKRRAREKSIRSAGKDPRSKRKWPPGKGKRSKPAPSG